jgi:ubiquinone biosynthesis protein
VLVDLQTGMLIYLDMGMVGELTVNQRMNLINLLLVARNSDVKGMGQVLRGLSTPFKKVDDRDYLRDFERKVGVYLEPGSGGSFGGAVNRAFEVLLDNGLRLDPSLTLALKALMQLEAITRTLDLPGGLTEEGFTITRDLVMEEVNADNVSRVLREQATLTAREAFQQLPDLQTATLSWLKQYKKGRFEVVLNTDQAEQELRKFRRLGNQIVVALMLAGMIIGSSFAATVSVETDDIWSLLPRVALLGYLFSMFIAAVFVIRLVWRLWRGHDEDD